MRTALVQSLQSLSDIKRSAVEVDRREERQASPEQSGRQETSGRSAGLERDLLGSQAENTLKTHAMDTSVGVAKGHERKGREGVLTARRRRTWRRRNPRGDRATALGNTGVVATDSATEEGPEGGTVVAGATGNRSR